MTVAEWAAKHRIVLSARMVASREAPGTPTGEYQTWQWEAATERGTIEFTDETDGSGPHDAFTHLFAWWPDIDHDEQAALGDAAVADMALVVAARS